MLSKQDGRVTFLIPWCGHTLLGTTDDDYQGDPSELVVSKSEKTYLLDTAKMYFPSVSITDSEIISTFAGLRCLEPQEQANPSKISRKHLLFSDKNGLVTIAGGKYTTFLTTGKDVLRWIRKQSPSLQFGHAKKIKKLANVSVDFGKKFSASDFEALIENEMAVTVSDLLKRRTLSFFLSQDQGQALIGEASRAIQSKLGLSETQIQNQVEEYIADIDRSKINEGN